MPDSPTGRQRYDEATSELRTTAKWLATVAAGIGAALVAGLQLTGLQGLSAARAVLAVAGVASAVAASLWSAYRLSEVFLSPWVTLSSIADQRLEGLIREHLGAPPRKTATLTRAVMHTLDNDKTELYGHVAPDFGTLYQKLTTDTDARAAAADVVAYANYLYTKELFRDARRRLTAPLAIVFAGVLVFALAQAPAPSTAKPDTAPPATTTTTTTSPASTTTGP